MKEKIFSAAVVIALLTSCGGSSSQKGSESDSDKTPVSKNETTKAVVADRESTASILEGMWYLDEYFSVIEDSQSVYKASKAVRSVFSAGFDKQVLMGDSPVVYGGSAHEGGFSAELAWDQENEVFRTLAEGNNNMADEPFHIEILADTLMKFAFESDTSDLVFRKIEGKNGVEKVINDILFSGTYELSDGQTVTFTREGEITGYSKLPDMNYEVMQDFFDYHMDVLVVSPGDGSSQYFHYVFNDDGFTLYEIYGDVPGDFKKGDLVNRFEKIGEASEKVADSDVFEGAEIETAYFDLPDKHKEVLKDVLKTEDVSVLEKKNLDVMKNYLDETVLARKSPFGASLESNYFWFVYNALPDFVSEDERHNGYYRDQNDQSMEENLIAYAIYRLDRSPENIERLFQYSRPLIKKMLPTSDRDPMGINQKVKDLLETYQFITRIEGYKEKLSDAYAAADTMTGKFIDRGDRKEFRKFENSAYGFTSYDLNEHIMEYLMPDVERFSYMPPETSFWMRRNHEGNMEVVFSILEEINEMMK